MFPNKNTAHVSQSSVLSERIASCLNVEVAILGSMTVGTVTVDVKQHDWRNSKLFVCLIFVVVVSVFLFFIYKTQQTNTDSALVYDTLPPESNILLATLSGRIKPKIVSI